MNTKELPAVVTFGRCGTHWLCSLIYQWFYWQRLEQVEMAGVQFQTWNNDHAVECPWLQLFGGHIFDPASRAAMELSPRKIIYLHRRGRDVLPSGWHLLRAANLIDNLHTPTFAEYLVAKTPPERSGINASPGHMGVREALRQSQSKWLDSGVFAVSYEDMVNDLNGVRDRIAALLGKKPEKLRHPASKHVGFVVPQGDKTNDELWDSVT